MSWVEYVEAILSTLKESSIGELELAEGDFEIFLRRVPAEPAQSMTAPLPRVQQMNLVIAPILIDIVAPLSGIYYDTPSPSAPPFIKVGDPVKPGQTVALIEAMKVFNEIQAEAAGLVAAIKVEHGKVVKRGDILLQIESIDGSG